MSLNAEAKIEQAAFLDDIEKRVSELFSAQKTEVEQSLVAKINREKEDAQKRIDAVNREFAQVRSLLDQHKAVMAELQTTEQHLRGEIRGHFERAVNYQKMMENAAALAGDELEKIGGLNQDLEQVRVKAESEYTALKDQMGGYAGLIAQIPVPPVRAESEIDWMKEIGKLRQVRDLMATLRQAGLSDEGGAPSSMSEEETSTPAAETAEELAASLGLIGPDEDSVHDDAEFALNVPAWPSNPAGGNGQPAVSPSLYGENEEDAALSPAETLAEARAEAVETESPAAPSAADAAALESLAGYRKTEPVTNGIELGFYTAGTGTFLDAVSFMTAIQNVVEGARQQHSQLTKTTSVKDLFLLKQEILNQQEIMRKVFFRVVRFCDKESGRLPESLGEVISSRGMKDIIERLTMANWSDPSDFKPFLNELNSLKRAFEARTAALPSYPQSVLDEVEGRLS
ncbi:MAG: hypothetical protein NTX99_11375 [Candidatus Aminicenantes bacterium]|nr:hypothetical protein [Candidatus Aminicenantes bacterium]